MFFFFSFFKEQMCQPFFQDSVVRLPLFCLYLRPGIACQFKGREDNRCLLPVMPVCCPVLPWSPSVQEQSLNPEIDSPTSFTLFRSYSFLHFFHLFGYSLGGELHTRLGTHVRPGDNFSSTLSFRHMKEKLNSKDLNSGYQSWRCWAISTYSWGQGVWKLY